MLKSMGYYEKKETQFLASPIMHYESAIMHYIFIPPSTWITWPVT